MLTMGIGDSIRLTDGNFLMYAMRAYQNPNCLDIDEFHDDLKHLIYVKRLLNRYLKTGDLQERLILNHIIVLYNVFGPEVCAKLLFFKLPSEMWPSAKTFLIYLHCMPEKISGIADFDIISSNIQLDATIVQRLREI